MQPLEELSDRLSNFWAPINHLHAVVNSPALREVYHRCLPKLADYQTELGHNQKLYQAIQSIANHLEYQRLNAAQRKVIDNYLRDFTLSGVSLPPEQKRRFSELAKSLSELATRFEENVLDATQAWAKHITDEKELSGIPPHAIALAKQTALARQKEGWVFTLDMPSYVAVITYADSSKFREEMYRAYMTRASDQGPSAGKFDNTDVMQKILSCRLEMARLLGFTNYAEYSLATKMVKTPDEALHFLNQLVEATRAKAEVEYAELQQFAKKTLKLKKLEAWDMGYVSEKLRQNRYRLTQEDLRPYFQESQVINGLFGVAERLFNITFERLSGVDAWHPDVKCYAVYDAKRNLRAYLYLDLYARENKRGGAWMDDHRARRRLLSGELQLPIAFINCNFNAPINQEPALFSHEEVETLFHEFGHSLQHMLTQIDYSEVSGIHGIPWDAVELSSQFLENWAWQKESLSLVTKHYQTGETLPDALFERMQEAKNYNTALQMMRQLELALFDMWIHLQYDPKQKDQIQHVLNEVRSRVAVVPVPEFNRFQHGFSHIFAGGYAAGYYSYKWAEVMAADAFSLFEEQGIFNPEAAKHFLTYILEPGGSADPADLFKAFRGRAPKVEALLKQSGIQQ